MAARSGPSSSNGAAPRPKGPVKKTTPAAAKKTSAKAEPKVKVQAEGPGRNEQAAIELIEALRELGHIRSAREELIAANLVTNSIAMDCALEDRNGYWLRQSSITVETLIQQLTPEHREDDPVEAMLRSITAGPVKP